MNCKIKLLEALAQLDEFSPGIESSTPLNGYAMLKIYLAEKLNIDEKDIAIYIDQINGNCSFFITLFAGKMNEQTYNFHEADLKLIPRKSKGHLQLIDDIWYGGHIYAKLSN